MNRKLQAMTIEIAQLQKQMNVQRGEQVCMAITWPIDFRARVAIASAFACPIDDRFASVQFGHGDHVRLVSAAAAACALATVPLRCAPVPAGNSDEKICCRLVHCINHTRRHWSMRARLQNILAQQNKDNSKRIDQIANNVTELAAEVHGEEHVHAGTVAY